MNKQSPGIKHHGVLGYVLWLWSIPFCILMTGIGLLLLQAAFLREDPMFWRNAGGYPVELRNAVLFLFYPVLLVHAGLLGLGFASLLRRLRPRPWRVMILFGGNLINLLILAIVVGIILWNNIVNLLEGSPFHSH